jgi:hypothetical protein
MFESSPVVGRAFFDPNCNCCRSQQPLNQIQRETYQMNSKSTITSKYLIYKHDDFEREGGHFCFG